MKIVAIKKDTAAINDGQWVDAIPNMGTVRLKVRGRTSRLYQAALDRHMAALPREMRDRVGNPTIDGRILAIGRAVHETILLDWDNVEDAKGKPLKFDSALAKEWLTNRDYEHFLDAVLYASAVVDHANQEAEGELAKN